jgi:hypothetical protein
MKVCLASGTDPGSGIVVPLMIAVLERAQRRFDLLPAPLVRQGELDGPRGGSSASACAAGLAKTRPYDLGHHTHSALMLAAGMSLQRLARIQGHRIGVFDETYSEELVEFEDRPDGSTQWAEIERARALDLGRSRRWRQSRWEGQMTLAVIRVLAPDASRRRCASEPVRPAFRRASKIDA